MFSFFQGRYVLRGFNEHEKTERVFSQLDQILGEQRLLEQLIREVRLTLLMSISASFSYNAEVKRHTVDKSIAMFKLFR